MRKSIIIASFAALTLALAGCHHDEEALSFAVRSQTVEEGQDLPVSVSILSGPRSGYAMSYAVDAYDVATGEAVPTGAVLLSEGSPAPTEGVSFPDGGHRDFTVAGLPAGTYKVSVSLTHGALFGESSCVSVVTRKETPAPTPDDEKKVTDVSVPGSGSGYKTETERGFTYIVLDLKDLKGKEITWRCAVSPADAKDPSLTASSDTPAVATAKVTDRTLLHVSPLAVGKAVVTVRSQDGGASRAFGVKVVDTTPAPEPEKVSDFTIPSMDPTYKKLPVTCGGTYEFTPTVTPSGANADFTAVSSDPSVAEVAVSGNKITIKGLYPGYTSITLTAADGPSKSFPVMVWKAVTVTTDWYELDASDAQIKRKCFPCKIRFSSDSDVAFPTPVTWTVAMKGVVTVSGKDTRSVSHKADVSFYGKNPAYYDVTNNILLPCYEIYRTDDFGLAVSLSLQRNEALDPDIWRITWKDDYLTQNARIKDYLTDIQQ